jgi:hypothetical protein
VAIVDSDKRANRIYSFLSQGLWTLAMVLNSK